MDAAYLSAISALAGSAIGGMTTGLVTWLSQREQARAGHVAHRFSRREDLIRDFIVAASKTYGDALVSNEPKMPDLVALYAMVSRMRALSMAGSVVAADKLMRAIVATYFEPNRKMRDLPEVLKSDSGLDPLREFSEVAREELGAFAPY